MVITIIVALMQRKNPSGEVSPSGDKDMYDIHNHLIDGIDDGALDFEDTLNICRAAEKDRIKSIVATPHYMEGVSVVATSKLFSKIKILNQELKNRGIDLTILPGMEVYISPDIMILYDRGEIITLNHSKYILIEFSVYGGIPLYTEHLLFDLQLKGIKPVIAHPERYRAIIKEPNIISDFIDNGCIIQVNSGSLQGFFGKEIQKTAYILLDHNMVHVISTDNHSSKNRMSSFRDCYKIISKKYSKSTADDLFIDNPYKIISGDDIHSQEPQKIKKRRFW